MEKQLVGVPVFVLFDDKGLENLVVETAKGNKTKKETCHFLEHGE